MVVEVVKLVVEKSYIIKYVGHRFMRGLRPTKAVTRWTSGAASVLFQCYSYIGHTAAFQQTLSVTPSQP